MSPPDTASRFLHSAGAATFSQLWRVGVTLATHVLLRRLVPREDWGLYDWAEMAFLVLGAVRDLGLPAHTIRIPERPFGNLLRLELGWGATLAALVAIGAPILALGMKDAHPLVVPVLQAMALFLFFEGLAAVPLVHLEGELEVRRAVFPEILRNLCYSGVAITLAIRGAGVWSMVIAQVAASAVFAAALWWRARGRIRLTTLRGRTPALLRSSVRLALIWLMILLVRHIDRVILGARFSVEDLAVYNFAYWAAFIVPMIMLQPVGRAAYPAFIAFAREPARQFDTYRVATVFLLGLEVPAALFLFVNADRVLTLIGGTQWEGAPAFLRILCFAPLVDPLSRFGGELLATRHRDRGWIVATAATLASFVVAGVLLTGRLGPVGMAWANYLPAGGVLMAWFLWRQDRAGLAAVVRDLAWIYLLPLPAFAAAWWLARDAPDLRLLLSFAALAVTAALYAWRFGASFRAFFRRVPEGPGGPPLA